MPTVFPVSLGCPKNLGDTETMLSILKARGMSIVGTEDAADIVLLNTCGFIKPAVDETKDNIQYYLTLKAQGKIGKLIVAGCTVQRYQTELAKKYPDVDTWVGVGGIEKIGDVLQQEGLILPALPSQYQVIERSVIATAAHSAYLKIADGCDNKCAYCTIPSIRGGYRSKPINDIIREAEFLVANGVKEVSLVAQDTTSYGIDIYGEFRLPELLKCLTKISGLQWIRLMYCYPERMSDEILRLIAEEPKVCKYLDLPLQHISDPILRSMRRRSSEADVRRTLDRIRTVVPGLALRTNFIVGFPGETEADVNKLEELIKEVRFHKVGVFTYWQERGTPASELSGQIPEKVKQKRADRIINVQSRVIDDMHKQRLGSIVTILMDTPTIGRTEYDAPDIDGVVQLSEKQLSGAFIRARLTSCTGYTFQGVPVT